MIVLDLNQSAGAAPAAEGYEGIPGVGGSSTAPPGLFANLLSSEQLALMGASPGTSSMVEKAKSSAIGDAALAAEAEASEQSAVPTTWNGLVQMTASVVSSGAPSDPAVAKNVPQGASSTAVASAIVAGQTPAATTEANTPPIEATQAMHTPAPASQEAGAETASAPADPSEGPLFTALAAGKPVVAGKPGVWVQTSVNATGEAAPPGVVSSANVVTVPSRAIRPDEPDAGLPGEALAVDVEPPADLAARSRAEVVRRTIGTVGEVGDVSANPKTPPATAPVAVPSAAKPSAADAKQTVEPVQVAQLDAQAAAKASESSKSTTLHAAIEPVPSSETIVEKLVPGAASAAEVDLAIAKSAEALREGAPLSRVEGGASATTQAMHRVEPDAAGTPTIRTPAAEFADVAVKSVRYLVSQGENVMRIKLIPENLGEMQLVVRSVGEALHVHVIAAHAHTRDAVEAQMQGLRDQLAKEGIEVTKITVSSDASGGQQFAQHSNNRDAFAMQQSARDGAPWRGYGHQNPASAHPDPLWTGENRTPRQHAGALNLFA